MDRKTPRLPDEIRKLILASVRGYWNTEAATVRAALYPNGMPSTEVLDRFLAENCELGNGRVERVVAWWVFAEWCDDNGLSHMVPGRTTFYALMESRPRVRKVVERANQSYFLMRWKPGVQRPLVNAR